MNTTLVVVIGLLGLAGAGAALIEMRRRRRDEILTSLLATFGPAVARVQVEPRELVAWANVAKTARALFPDAFQELDMARGARFPFPEAVIEATHARWTAQWLAWEREHDLEYKGKAIQVEADLESGSVEQTPRLQRRLASIEQEKLQRYQERYEEYVRVGKAMSELD